MAALRWTKLLMMTRTRELSTMKIGKADAKLENEVIWHDAALYIYQAAASGQPRISFAKEDSNPGDSSREDIRGLVDGVPAAPQEAKAKYHLANSTSNGIEQNRAGLSKVRAYVSSVSSVICLIVVLFFQILKCICDKYTAPLVHYNTYLARIEAVWMMKLTFRDTGFETAEENLPEQQSHLVDSFVKSKYEHLSRVEVAPSFPRDEETTAAGAICTDISRVLRSLLQRPASTFSDLLYACSAGNSQESPPGFEFLVRYVDRLCLEHGIEIVKPEAVFSSSSIPHLDLSTAEVVHMGPKSVVLRLPNDDSVLKVSRDMLTSLPLSCLQNISDILNTDWTHCAS